jgi:exodeoxyribonuclease VII large subunit
MINNNTLSLYDVSQKIQEALDTSFPSTIWVVAEISELKENRTGHCYLELVEKEEGNDQPKAKARATIWSRSYRMLKPFFETSTNRQLSAGIKILIQCTVNYHPLYGLSLNIIDIDPTFTIGDIEQKRQETINRLIADGVFGMNKEVDFPFLPKKIAVVSSPTAAGYQDFTHQLDNNQYGYVIEYKLFSATMQGEKAEDSIIAALNQIHDTIDSWDVVAVMRGGGSQMDLGCFDGYNLASNIAQFPIPIITGIGHEKDVTIADMVAHTRQKTPTAVAEFLIDQFVNAENWMHEAKDDFINSVSEVISTEKLRISKIQGRTFPRILKLISVEDIKLHRQLLAGKEAVGKIISINSHKLQHTINTISIMVESTIKEKDFRLMHLRNWVKVNPLIQIKQLKERLNFIDKNVDAHNPERILSRGFSLSLINGKVIKNSMQIKEGERIETILSTGKISSIVDKINMSRDKLA